MAKIRKGDEVVVLSGKNKGARGTISQVIVDAERVVVSGVNLIKKHVKPNPQKGVEGGVVSKEASIHISNVAIYNPQTKAADRVGFRFVDVGGVQKKVRFFKSNNELIDGVK